MQHKCPGRAVSDGCIRSSTMPGISLRHINVTSGAVPQMVALGALSPMDAPNLVLPQIAAPTENGPFANRLENNCLGTVFTEFEVRRPETEAAKLGWLKASGVARESLTREVWEQDMESHME